MKKALVFVGIIAVIAVVFIGVYNSCIRFENQISAVDKDMQNVHASMFNNMKSQGIAVEKYGDLVIKALEVAMSGRYGKDGSQAGMQWIKEQNPSIDPKIFSKLQVVMEAGYNKFEATQRTKIDVVKSYKNHIQTFPNNILSGVFGFPRKSWADLESIITTAETKKTWEKGEMQTIDPFAK